MIGGFLKGALGFGLPILGIPVLTVTHSLPFALSLAILPTILTNVAQLWVFRAHRKISFLPLFLSGGALGMCLGGAILARINNAYIEIALGVMVLAYLASRLRPSAPNAVGNQKIAPAVGVLAGSVHGATGLSGLIGTPYVHSLGLARPAFVFAVGSMFTLFSLMQAPILIFFGLFEISSLWLSVVVTPFTFAGLYFGGLVGGQMQSATFSRVVMVVLGVTAVMPILNGVRSLLGS